MNPLRSLILAAAGNDVIRRLVATAPVSRDVVRRFVAGETTADAIEVTRNLVGQGLTVTLDYLGEDTTDTSLAEQTVQAYLELLDGLHAEGLAERAEVSVKLSAVGPGARRAPRARERLAHLRGGRAVRHHGHPRHGGPHHHRLHAARARRAAPRRGRGWARSLQAYLHRTEEDCARLASQGSRVRLCKGAYAEPPEVAFPEPHDVDRSYVRCANVLLRGDGFPMFATHDPRLVEIVAARAEATERKPGSFEFQMLYGIRPDEQLRLAGLGHTVRVYVPYGVQWYGYLMRRLAERPANTAFFLRALVSRK